MSAMAAELTLEQELEACVAGRISACLACGAAVTAAADLAIVCDSCGARLDPGPQTIQTRLELV